MPSSHWKFESHMPEARQFAPNIAAPVMLRPDTGCWRDGRQGWLLLRGGGFDFCELQAVMQIAHIAISDIAARRSRRVEDLRRSVGMLTLS